MPRGKGIPWRVCWCQICQRNFLACREDAITCSAKCRKARNRLLGGKPNMVTEKLDASSGLPVTKDQEIHDGH
jgi:hypothetical protein